MRHPACHVPNFQEYIEEGKNLKNNHTEHIIPEQTYEEHTLSTPQQNLKIIQRIIVIDILFHIFSIFLFSDMLAKQIISNNNGIIALVVSITRI